MRVLQVSFLSYEEWESKDKLHEHYRTDLHKQWKGFVHKHDVRVKVFMAIPVNDMSAFDY